MRRPSHGGAASPDPETVAVIERFAASGVSAYDQLGVLEARRVLENVTRLQGDPQPVGEVRDLLIAGADGRLPARLYRPYADDGLGVGDDLGLVVYLHGGGWALGSVASADRPCRALAAASGCGVVSVEYRRPPETPFPGPFEDCVAACDWLVGHARSLGADPARVAVMGDSAGGNLAAAVALAARDRGGPAFAAQVLVYPALTPVPGADYPSRRDNATGYLLTLQEMAWFWELYLGSVNDRANPYAAPLAAGSLAGVAPAVIVTAGFDPLRDEALDYGRRLGAEGVDVEHLAYPSTIHGALWMAAALTSGRRMLDDVAGCLRSRLGPATTTT
ncbi:MAG: alpha/beta hydrolase [Acidimicrobiales bacterium]